MVKTIFLNSVSNKKQTTVIDICYLHQPKQKYKQLDARLDIFDALEKFNGSKLPECVKTILKHSAYDSAETLGLLDGIHVSEIEMYINETDHSVIDNLSCCNSSTYQNQQQFRFLPGHKGIILAIPAQISKMKAAKNTRGQRSLEFKKMLTKAELLELLLKKLNNFFSKAGWTTHSLFTEAHLSSFQMRISDNAMTAQCNVKCVHCSAESLSVYRNSWGISNIIRHLKTHLNKMAEAPTSKEGRNLSKGAKLIYCIGY